MPGLDQFRWWSATRRILSGSARATPSNCFVHVISQTARHPPHHGPRTRRPGEVLEDGGYRIGLDVRAVPCSNHQARIPKLGWQTHGIEGGLTDLAGATGDQKARFAVTTDQPRNKTVA